MSIKKPTLERMCASFCQQEDTAGRPHEVWQSIDFEIIRMDEGPDDYYTVIKTDRWAFKDEGELVEVFHRFKTAIDAAQRNNRSAGPSA